MYRYKAKVDRILDGDTVYLTVDLGFHIQQKIKVRLLDVDAPEVRTRVPAEKLRGIKVLNYVEKLLEDGTCEVDTQKTGKFGRWLGVLYKDGINLNELINDFIKVL